MQRLPGTYTRVGATTPGSQRQGLVLTGSAAGRGPSGDATHPGKRVQAPWGSSGGNPRPADTRAGCGPASRAPGPVQSWAAPLPACPRRRPSQLTSHEPAGARDRSEAGPNRPKGRLSAERLSTPSQLLQKSANPAVAVSTSSASAAGYRLDNDLRRRAILP